MENDFDIEIKKYLNNGAKLNENYILKDIPATDGIYIVECPNGVIPEFSDYTRAIKTQKITKGKRKGELKSTEEHTAQELQIKYNNVNKQILYIGSAPLNKNGKRGLRRRVTELIKHGFHMGTQHYGGKELWQIKNIRDMNLYWCPVENPIKKEHELLIQHSKDYPNLKNMGQFFVYPLANGRS